MKIYEFTKAVAEIVSKGSGRVAADVDPEWKLCARQAFDPGADPEDQTDAASYIATEILESAGYQV